jgi:uncharacterized protein YsxB (DUF464 family)
VLLRNAEYGGDAVCAGVAAVVLVISQDEMIASGHRYSA